MDEEDAFETVSFNGVSAAVPLEGKAVLRKALADFGGVEVERIEEQGR